MSDVTDKARAWDAVAEKNAENDHLRSELDTANSALGSMGRDMAKLGRENERLRAAIKLAHATLTKSSLVPAERVHDATAVLSRVLEQPPTSTET